MLCFFQNSKNLNFWHHFFFITNLNFRMMENKPNRDSHQKSTELIAWGINNDGQLGIGEQFVRTTLYSVYFSQK